MDELLRGLRADLERALRKLDALLEKDLRTEEALKKPNGRLTEAGVQKLRTMLDAGVGVAEIARILAISQTAVIQHRRKLEAERITDKRSRSRQRR